mmetsp:Transcript_23292/g.75462  ORF Transcript_23292/g.75462 Transcript_23292/m.75462 type:complete len:248 (+) Transcript_23292:455-1198(+)
MERQRRRGRRRSSARHHRRSTPDRRRRVTVQRLGFAVRRVHRDHPVDLSRRRHPLIRLVGRHQWLALRAGGLVAPLYREGGPLAFERRGGAAHHVAPSREGHGGQRAVRHTVGQSSHAHLACRCHSWTVAHGAACHTLGARAAQQVDGGRRTPDRAAGGRGGAGGARLRLDQPGAPPHRRRSERRGPPSLLLPVARVAEVLCRSLRRGGGLHTAAPYPACPWSGQGRRGAGAAVGSWGGRLGRATAV